MKTAIVITTYNRPEYLGKCFQSLLKTHIPEDTLIYIIDDKSTNRDTLKLIHEFNPKCKVVKNIKNKNTGILHSLLIAYDSCFENGYDYVIVMNDDAIVNNYFFDTMTYYKTIFPDYVISGFNTLTSSELGTPRHPVIHDGGFYAVKNSSGGLCLGLDKHIFNTYFKPEIIEKIHVNNKHAYDTVSTHSASKHGCKVICPVPSVVEHIGFNSIMGHDFNPDVSCDFKPYVELLDRKKITVNMATFPARYDAFEKVILNLLSIDIIDKIRVYLNGYVTVPQFLKNSRIEYVIGKPDIMDTGKFYWAGDLKNEYYFTLDDDFIIDSEYIQKHIQLLNSYNDGVFVSLHGKVLNEIPSSFRDLKDHFDFSADVMNNKWSNFLGTGVMVFDNSKFKIDLDYFENHGMTDLYIAKYCQELQIPGMVRKHLKNDIKLIYRGPDELWNRRDEFAKQHKVILNSIKKWLVYDRHY